MTEDKNAAPAQRTHVSSEDRSMGSHGRFHWNELMTHDVERAKRFYAETIGWDFEPTPIPEGTYWVAKRDGEPVGGIFAMRGPHFATMPEHWVSYLAVDDVDAASRRRWQPAPEPYARPSTLRASAASPSCTSPAAPWSAG